MRDTYKFTAVIQNAGDGGAYVNVPFDVEEAFGQKRVKIKGLIAGQPYRGSLVRMGGPGHLLPVLREIREKAGKTFGDEIDVEIEEDTEPRRVAAPPDFMQALKASPEAAAFFGQLSYTHQREYVLWIEEAKRLQTRQDRVARAVELLKQGKKTH